MSDPTMLVPPGPVLFLPGWQLLLPEYCKLNLGLRFGDCTGIPCLSEDRFFFSVFLQTERCFGVGGGGYVLMVYLQGYRLLCVSLFYLSLT